MSFYLINLKSSNKIASWSDAPYPIYKTQKKISAKQYKDLKQNIQVFIMNVRFKVSSSNIVFCHSSQILAPFPHEKQWGTQHIHQPNFSYFYPFIFCFNYLLGCHFCWSSSFFFNGTMFNICKSSSSSFFSIECLPFLFTNFVFPLPPPLVQFVLARIMLGLENDEFNKDGRNTPLPMPSILWSCPSTFGSSIMKKKEVLQLALQLNFWVAMNTCNSLYFYIVRV